MALQACAFADLGWAREDGALLQHATRLYAQALRETNKALQDPDYVQSDDLLACCRLLSLFELFRRSPACSATGQSQASDWQSHVDGTCGLVRLREPERHTSEHGVNLYDGVRMTAVIHGLKRRQPNSFTTLSWDLPRRTLRDELFELTCVVPELLQQIDQVSGNIARLREDALDGDRNQMSRRGQELVQRCLGVGKELQEWENKALDLCREHQPTEGPGASEATTDPSQDRPSLFVVCKSHGNGFFFICTQYWAICTTLYSSIQRFSSFLDTASLNNHVPQLSDWMDPEPHALNIAHTAAHFFRPEVGLWAAQSATIPIGRALSYFARTGGRDSAPIKMTIDAFADKKAGASLRDFLQSVIGARALAGAEVWTRFHEDQGLVVTTASGIFYKLEPPSDFCQLTARYLRSCPGPRKGDSIAYKTTLGARGVQQAG